ncbi:MAG: hypothetical protein CVT59_02680 [Actinobacteria bacterium HGW-Actinobacteria-1]|nr:MAG: hypothetical protein CVT59_02680 [Actinobacteria bacterium HGW-Actinobacteria-1]
MCLLRRCGGLWGLSQMKMQLAPEQDAVVHAPAGDLFVAAAAGSGKTRVLVARFVAAVLGEIELGPCSATDVLAVTFTDKAAGEIAERVRAALLAEGRDSEARRVDQAWVSTIHKMCSRILRRHAFEAGLDPRFSVATQVEAGILEQEAFERATRALMATDVSVERLVIDFGAARVASMVSRAHGALRSMGRGVSELRVSDVPFDRSLREWSAEFGLLAEQYTNLGSTQTVATGAASARACACALDAIPRANDQTAAAREALQSLADAKFYKKGSQEVKERAEAAQDLVAAVSASVAQIVAAPYEQALVRVLEAFDSAYEAAKAERGVLDFEDLQLKTAVLLETQPDIASRYQEAFKLVMIDEFQDTNALQLRIARALSSDDLLTVGDDKQSIYRFRHADVGVFKSLADQASSVSVLRSNYRSHQDVIGVINELFDTSTFFGGDFVRLSAMRDERVPYAWPEAERRVQFLLTDAQATNAETKRAMEAASIARRLAALREAGVPQGDMVVLLRAMTRRSEGIESALVAEGFDVYVASGGTYFERAEVDEVVSLLSVIDNPRDDTALMRILAGRMVALEEHTLYRLANMAGPKCLWDALAHLDEADVPSHDTEAIGRIVSTVEALRRNRGKRGISELIHEACELLDYDLVLFASGAAGPRAWANVLKLGRLAEEYEQRSAGDLGGFLRHVALHRDLSPEKQATLTGEGIDAVRIMSVHAAKGLEFPVVVVGDLASGGDASCGDVLVSRAQEPLLAVRVPKSLFPDGKSVESAAFSDLKEQESSEDLAEADRLLYVACTRAREALILSACVDLSKSAEGRSDIDRLRRAARIAQPAAELGTEVSVGADCSFAVHVVSVPAPAGPACETAGSTESGPLPQIAPMLAATLPPSLPSAVSYTGLSVYADCTYKFYATRIARLKTPTTHATAGPLGFGSAVHAALQLSATGETPDQARLSRIARAHGLTEDHVGHLQVAVQGYLDSETARTVRAAERVHAECPFAVPLGDTILQGSIDLLAWTGSVATVVDYKTGAGELSSEEAVARYQSQAECYALAVLQAGASCVDVRFVEVERGCRETRFEYRPVDAGRIAAKLTGVVSAIKRGEFAPLQEYTARVCYDCPALGGTCPVNPRRGAAV